MTQVAIKVNGRTYRLSCRDGEEGRIQELATHINSKIERLTSEFGQMAPERLLVMAAILTADELWEAREQLGGKGLAGETGGETESKLDKNAVAGEPGIVPGAPRAS